MSVITVPTKSTHSGIPPTNEEIDSLLRTIIDTDNAQTALDASYSLTNLLVQSVGARGLLTYDILDQTKKAAADKKNGAKRESAMFILGALFERMPREQPLSEVIFLVKDGGVLNVVLDGLADKGGSVRESAQFAVDELFKNLSPEAMVVGLLPALLRYLSKSTGKWQGTVGAYNLLGKMADRAQIGDGTKEEEQAKDVLRESMGLMLKELIPIVENGMHDLKAEVGKAATKAMTSLTTLLQNDDVAPRIALLLDVMKNPKPENTHKAVHALSQTTFVAEVTSPVLAMLTPYLERALNTPSTPQEVLRQTTVVIENLTRLVHDPIEARVFLPKLMPGVQKVKNVDVMKQAMGEGADAETKGQLSRTTMEDVLKVLELKMRAQGGIQKEDAALWKLGQTYVSDLVKEDVNIRVFDRIPDRIAPYLRYILPDDLRTAVANAVQQHFVEEDHKKYGAPVVDDPTEVEVVNADFSLGYGGMLLLSHTNLRLLKGHRYGLCGRNGCGKSTLMRSIANGKLEGFPPQDVLKTCFVEHNQGEDADITILEYVSKDPEIAKEGQERISSVLEEVGFTSGPEGRQSHKVGSLSGGWKMKLALARAMLMRADVFLLDEPTNHLDVANVKWLENYLNTHSEITSLIVSHDSGFLDAVCTNIIHYEQKKLKTYTGNLADFVKVKPEAKTYYTLSAAQVQFKFPPPGILTGVKSTTRSIIRMTDVSYTYPGGSKPSLQDVTCQLSLSSRVAIIGANGAGKSTLIKLLTGETIPNTGKVEKHPNLRIGYIKQHALEHVEMHTEKTPTQYLLWRYAHGDDREVLMKQTRVLTAEDRAQMDKWLDLGDGKGERQVESLIGRQKYKKTFQYEVKWRNMLPKFNSQVSRETLLEWGFAKLVQEFDDHESSREGLGYRILEPKVIAKHFEDVGLDPEIAAHNEIGGLSGGQKVKVVLAGAMWNNPHLLVMDEPTNFLDRDSLGGLATAVREFRGGVVMISHNEEFVGALCPEQWHIKDGRLDHRGHLAVDLSRFEDSRPGSSAVSSAGGSLQVSRAGSPMASHEGTPAASGAEDNSEMNFKGKKKKKMTKKQLKEREVRRRLRYIEWLNSPKGTPQPPNSDEEDG
ncbi:[NU+] prion formation protein 1 [Cyphellophora attinorum]|uniref:[NU+] prion formation protein 1 n=1 Tax=Cyphellophora attinorum TaxID=1664694 RepID=A0A0N1HAH6_9EURO|nr:[NU+] prion formation protein 1 [Phialophora attinorum]KPI39646.1 [NU+] prion formation protein 1 [Phialophora attinorum]